MSDLARDAIVPLLELTQRLSQDAPLEEHLRAVTETALLVLPCDHASIRVVDASGEELLASARSGVGVTEDAVRLKKGDGIAGWVLAHGRPAHVSDTRDDARFVRAPKQGFTVLSMIAAPLLYGGRTIGIFSVSSPEPGAFTSDDELLARLLANCSVPAIERSRLERLSATDEMTLAFTSRYLLPRVNEEMERARGSKSAVALLSMDLDRFRHVNESYGQPVGDRVLCIFVERVREAARAFDVLVRSAGDQFTLLMPQTTKEDASATAERLRKHIGESAMEPMPSAFLTQTVSIGVATWDGKESAEELREGADFAMREAKERGRDCVVARA